MRKIRQNNDIDIKVYIKDKDANKYLDPTSCRDISIRLQTASKKVPITDYQLSSEGHIDFRFHAKDQTRIGIYTIVISATTDDGRVFTTDVCDAFALVACSCEAGGESEIKVETLDLTAEFAITAWGSDEERIEALEKGKQDNIEDLDAIREGAKLGATALQEFYDDGSHEVVPVKHPDLSTQPSILPYKFAGNYVYEQMVYVESGVNDDATFWDKTICDLPKDFLLLEMFGQIERANGSIMAVSYPYGTEGNTFFSVTLDGNKLHAHGVGNDFKSAWFRVVWTTNPKAGEYYYQQGGNEAALTLRANSSTMATFSMTLSIYGREFDWIENNGEIKLYGDLLNKFLTGEAVIKINRGSSHTRTIIFRVRETGEQGSMFEYDEGDIFTVVDLGISAPYSLSGLTRGFPQILDLSFDNE